MVLGARAVIFMVLGARAVISFCIRSAIPGYMVEPPDRTTLAYRSFLINIALHDGVVGSLVDTNRLKTQELGLEESLRAPEPLVANGDDLSVGKLVGLLQGGRGGG